VIAGTGGVVTSFPDPIPLDAMTTYHLHVTAKGSTYTPTANGQTISCTTASAALTGTQIGIHAALAGGPTILPSIDNLTASPL
jgi:hypothetical protein